MATKKTPKFEPTAGYALIEPVEIEKKTPTGIVLPDTHEEKSQKGKIIALGAPRMTDSGQEIKPDFKVGDEVVYKKWGGDEIRFTLTGKEMIFVKFEDVLAILR